MIGAPAAIAEATYPEEFAPVFAQNHVVVVGGHAVNLWATFYAPRGDPALRAFAPFTSKDGDIFLKDRENAAVIAATAGWRFHRNPETRSALIGAITMTRAGAELHVDVLRSVTGLTDADLCRTVPMMLADGGRYVAPWPGVMLKAKLANLRTLDQSGRQDERHVRMLVLCCAHFLRDASDAATAGALSERDAVNYFTDASDVIREPGAVALDARYGLGLSNAIPGLETLGDLSAAGKIAAFYRHRSAWENRT